MLSRSRPQPLSRFDSVVAHLSATIPAYSEHTTLKPILILQNPLHELLIHLTLSLFPPNFISNRKLVGIKLGGTALRVPLKASHSVHFSQMGGNSKPSLLSPLQGCHTNSLGPEDTRGLRGTQHGAYYL